MLAELLPFRWWYIWVLFMVAITPIALWASLPALIAPAAFASIAAIYAVQLRGTRTRMALLKWGQVATVTGTAILSRGTYYSGTTWYNAPLPVARGWQVSRPLYSGPSTKTQIGYTLGGYQGQITVRGREYIDGVVLADERRPQRALCVTSFAYDLDRDPAGNWTGRLRPRLRLGIAVWLLILIGWLGGAAAYATGYAQQHLLAVNIGPGESATVAGTDKIVNCNGGHLTVDDINATVTVHGHCATVTVSGIDNAVHIDTADTIELGGIGNRVTYQSGTPQINGSNSNVSRG